MTRRSEELLITEAHQVDAGWLARVLARSVGELRVHPIGTGQIGSVLRVVSSEPDVPAVLVKLPAPDPAARALLTGPYRNEVRFYSEVADTVRVRVPGVHLAVMAESGPEFTLVLEDLAPARPGDQIAGCGDQQALAAAINLAGLHGPRWCDPTLPDIEGLSVNGAEDAALMGQFFTEATEEFLRRLGDRLTPRTGEVLRCTADLIERWARCEGGRIDRFSLVHGDYRLDNLMFADTAGPDERPTTWAVDWQTLSLGLPARDLAFLAGTSLAPGQRRRLDRDLVAAHHEALVQHGVSGYSLEQSWDDYRFAMLQGPLVAVFGYAYGARTDRGDAMFVAMVERAAVAIDDLGTLDLVSG